MSNTQSNTAGMVRTRGQAIDGNAASEPLSARTSNRRVLELKELVAHEANGEAGLADGSVTQQHQLVVEQIPRLHLQGHQRLGRPHTSVTRHTKR